MYVVLHVKYPLFLSDFNETRMLTADFKKIVKHDISRKSVQWELSCSVRTIRQIDKQKRTNKRFSKYVLRKRLKEIHCVSYIKSTLV
jgi:hypothetical protein